MSADPTPTSPEEDADRKREETIAKRQQEAPGSLLSVNGCLLLLVLVGLAAVLYFTLWPR